jgi:hypothetical protein
MYACMYACVCGFILFFVLVLIDSRELAHIKAYDVFVCIYACIIPYVLSLDRPLKTKGPEADMVWPKWQINVERLDEPNHGPPQALGMECTHA